MEDHFVVCFKLSVIEREIPMHAPRQIIMKDCNIARLNETDVNRKGVFD
jgi:hypothetical protein